MLSKVVEQVRAARTEDRVDRALEMGSKKLVKRARKGDVAAALAVAAGAPVNGTIELAGPELFRLDELTRRVLSANGDPRRVTPDDSARYFGAELDDGSLVPGDDARIAPTRFEDWVSQTMVSKRTEGGSE